MEFWQQYKTPQWQKKRLEQLERSEWSCSCCGANEKQLQVHHRQYIKGRKIWEYSSDELEVLCDDCHEDAHEVLSKLKNILIKLNSIEVERLIGYCEGKFLLGSFPDDELEVKNHEHAEGIADAFKISAKEVIEIATNSNKSVTARKLLPSLWESEEKTKDA